MKKIANIVSNYNEDVSELFNVVKEYNDIIFGLPTLIMDFYFVNKHFPNFDVLDYKIEENIYWGFSRKENRDKHDEILLKFIQEVYDNEIKNIHYFYLDLINYKNKTIYRAIKKIYNSKKIITYYNKNIFYIYVDNIIFGIDENLLNLFEFDVEKIKNKIKLKSDIYLSDILLNQYTKVINELQDKTRFLPLFI